MRRKKEKKEVGGASPVQGAHLQSASLRDRKEGKKKKSEKRGKGRKRKDRAMPLL